MRRLVVYYAVLAVALVAVVTGVFAAVRDVDPQPSVAGGYDVTAGAGCLVERFDLRQSGRFVNLEREGDAAGRLTLRDGRLTGDVHCDDGATRALEATIESGALRGSVGGEPLQAVLRREPPEPGSVQGTAPPDVAGLHRLTPPSVCLGGRLELDGGARVHVVRPSGEDLGTLTYDDGRLTGVLRCVEGGSAQIEGRAADRSIALTVTPTDGAPERVSAERQREFGHTLAAFFLAVAVVMLFARLVGLAAARIGQPRVMGEVLAGILLGPTVLGALAPEVQRMLFPSDVIPYLGVAANLGLIFYMFLVGLEIDLSQLRGRLSQTLAISNTGIAIPMMAGMALAVPIYARVAPDTGFAGFALFMGVSMSITAFPVLARILVERRMLRRPLGAVVMASAAIDDVTAWFLIALATAVAVAGSAVGVVQTIGLALVFCLVMGVVVRPLLARVAVAFDEAGRVPVAWVTAIFAGVLLSAYVTEEIGIALIFGAFVMGAVMPRHAGLTEDVTHRVEDFVLLLLLPLFFAYTGLRTDVGLLDRPELVVILVVILVVAVACKFGGAILAARVVGMGWRESAVIGALMNTRGLTELIVLNLALEKGIISEALFAALVLMALVTTFMTGPMLRVLDRDNRFGATVEEELAATASAPSSDRPVEGAVLVVAQDGRDAERLVDFAAPLTRVEPPRELVVTRMLRPPRGAELRGAIGTELTGLEDASRELHRVRDDLTAHGVVARVAAFTSTDVGSDVTRLAEQEDVHLVLMEGRRPLLGAGIPRGAVGEVLEQAPCDVAVLVDRDDHGPIVEAGSRVVVPFGGLEHDWAALELGAWLARAHGARLVLLGSSGDGDRDASRLLANASLLVQRFAGVAAESVVVEPDGDALIDAATGAALLIVGLRDDWRTEGLGDTRAQIVAAAPAPIVLVRRGTRPGALAPRTDVTRFNWTSTVAPPAAPAAGN